MNIVILDQSKHTLNKPAIILRDLWRELELTEKYADWIQRQLTEFVQGVDFVRVQVYLNPTNNLPVSDIAVTFETAKHIALMSRTAKGREYRQRLIELESTQQPQFTLPKNFSEALRMLADETDAHQETKVQLEHKTECLNTAAGHIKTALEVMTITVPKAKAFDEVLDKGENVLISEAAKTLGVKQHELFGWLSTHGWIFRRGSKPWQAYADKIKNQLLAHRYTKGTDGDGKQHTKCQVMVTPAGIVVLRALLGL